VYRWDDDIKRNISRMEHEIRDSLVPMEDVITYAVIANTTMQLRKNTEVRCAAEQLSTFHTMPYNVKPVIDSTRMLI
jgi:hypothetical protein